MLESLLKHSVLTNQLLKCRNSLFMQILLSFVLVLMSSEFTNICIAKVFYDGFTLKIKGQNIILEHFWMAVLKKYRSLQCRHDSIN